MQKTPLHIMLHRNTFIRNHYIYIYIYAIRPLLSWLERPLAGMLLAIVVIDEQETCAAKHLGEAALHAF